MYRYTVTVDNRKIDLEAYSPRSAASHAMQQLKVNQASLIKVVSSENERAEFTNVCYVGNGWIQYEKKD